jgi:hypothetical protein
MSLKRLEGYELDNEIATVGVRLFLERWRKEYKKSVRHWLITELGHEGTENIHLHGIIWTDEDYDKIVKHWGYGYVYPRNKEELDGNYVNERTINYIVKYVTGVDVKHKEYKSKILTSAGIGRNYVNRSDSKINKFKGKDTKETYKNRQGYEMNMPIYYRNKIYSEEEREQLWLIKLDEDVRWVMGEKVKGSGKDYMKLVEYYRKENKRLGYGNDEKNWDRLVYENERRKMNMKKRMEKIMKDEK